MAQPHDVEELLEQTADQLEEGDPNQQQAAQGSQSPLH
jgi:hypothetical protein